MDKNLINKIKNEKIDYIVEWWEDDSLDIDSNQHVLFLLKNEDIDIIVTEKNIDEINTQLRERMNNKKALAKTFWNIWEWWVVGLVRYLAIGEGICLGRDGL